MADYLNWDTKNEPNADETRIDELYNLGYVATRVDKGIFNKTRSFRIKLAEFELSSENRRVLRKNEHVALEVHSLPYEQYHWSIHKLAKDFYTTKFGEDTFSANKAKELMTDVTRSNFNRLFVYRDSRNDRAIGYAICLQTTSLLHYSYPFYAQKDNTSNLGMGMMVKAVEHAKNKGLQYAYLGSLQRPSDTYKLQFNGMEWFDGHTWRSDLEPLKELLR